MRATDLLAVALALAGAALLRRAWRRRDRMALGLRIGGWAALAGSCALWALGHRPEVGLALGAVCGSVAVLLLVAASYTRRPRRPRRTREAAAEPRRPGRVRRGVARTLLAGPLAGVAAMAAGLGYAVSGPGLEQDRLIIGGLLVPFAWAAAMTFALAASRLGRAGLALLLVTLGGVAAAFAPGRLA